MMKQSVLRILFACVSVLLLTAVFAGQIFEDPKLGIPVGIGAGLLLSLVIFGLDKLTHRMHLRTLNIAILGLFLGYLFARATMLIIGSAVTPQLLGESSYLLIQSFVYLFAVYFTTTHVAKAADELHISIPFVKFNPVQQKKKDIIVDMSLLLDSRIIDVAASGLLDSHLVLPRFLLKELHKMIEEEDESVRGKARRSLEVIKKLEAIPELELRYADTEFPEVKDPLTRMIRIARLMDANIMTADMSRVQESTIEGIRIININTLSNSLKPLTTNGEFLLIKIQRYGKEARQGVGYLDDGTMVVVNGGAEYIGETVKAQVLSVKHTSSGRMIFCNATEEHLLDGEQEHHQEAVLADKDSTHKKYFAL